MNPLKTLSSVSFFYPSKVLGGAEILFYRLANIMADDWGVDVYYIDYADGYVRKLLGTKNKINFLTFDLTNDATGLPCDTVLITPLSSIIDVSTYLKKDIFRVLFWSIHPMGLQSFLEMGFKKLRLEAYMPSLNDLGPELDRLIERKALVFMDDSNFSCQTGVFKMQTRNPQFLPILCEDACTKKIYKVSSGVVKLAWLGRLSIEKTYSLLNILENCNSYLSRYEGFVIEFHVIGKGECSDMIQKFSCHKNLILIKKTDLSGNELNNYLVENSDILFAMGTSALEGGSMNLATVLVDFSYRPLNSQEKFRWLYETSGYSLGSLAEVTFDKKYSFDDIITVLRNNTVGIHAAKCYDYYLNNHSPKIVAANIKICLQETQVTNHDLLTTKFRKYFWINNIRKKFHYLKTICKKF